MKKCNKCGADKPLDSFSKHKGCIHGVRNTCKQCVKGEASAYRKRKRREIKEKILSGEIDSQAKCISCKCVKGREGFFINHNKNNGLSSRCKECTVERNRELRDINPEKYSEYQKNYYRKNKDSILSKEKMWREENREEILERRRVYYRENSGKIKRVNYEYKKKRLKDDPVFYCAELCRRRISKCLQERGFLKTGSTGKMLGCDWNHLKDHIESQFQDGMSWDNRGDWHIDHIIPLARAKTIEDVERLCHYTNLQPLWASENMSKGSK